VSSQIHFIAASYFGKELPISVPTGNRNPVFQPVVSHYRVAKKVRIYFLNNGKNKRFSGFE
jgi:hypothetical protein